MRRPKALAELTRLSIIDAAFEVFSHKGYTDTRLEDIAKTAKITTGAIYHYFDSKLDLFNVLMKLGIREDDPLGLATLDPLMPEASLSAFLHDPLRRAEREPRYRAIMEIQTNAVSIPSELEALTATRKAEENQILAAVEKLIRAGKKSGAFRADLSVADAAVAVLAFQHGLLRGWLASPEQFTPAKVSNMVNMFIRGLLA